MERFHGVPTSTILAELERRSRSLPPTHVCRPVVISGPSGVGKGTLVNMLREKYPNEFGYSVSHTTRNPRKGEVDGQHYHFVNKEQFKQTKFVEWANVHGNFYGTSVSSVQDIRRKYQVPMLEIDVEGSSQLREAGDFDAQYIFIQPPSMEELERRLRGRGTEREEQIRTRLANASGEMERAKDGTIYDEIITNDGLDAAFTEINRFVASNMERCKEQRSQQRF